MGWHVDPVPMELAQSPKPPLVGATTSHGFGEQVAVVSVPALHDDVPDTVYPELQVGVHDEPCARVEVQLFKAPLEMAPDASQELHAPVSS